MSMKRPSDLHRQRAGSLPPALLAFAKAHCDSRMLSVYVSGGESDPAGGRTWEVVLKRGIANARRAVARQVKPEREAFDTCVARLMARVPAGRAMHRVNGWVCFVSDTGDVHVELLPAHVPSSVTWQQGIRLVPYLASMAPHSAIVAAVDREHARLFRLANGSLTELEAHDISHGVEAGTHMGSAPRQGFHSGTRGETQHDAAERHLRELHDRHVAAMAERIAALAGPDANVVLGGASETASRIAVALPPAFAGRTVLAAELHTVTPHADVERLAAEALRTLESDRQRGLVRKLLADEPVAGHAVTGLPGVIRAIEQGAVDHLLVSRRIAVRQSAAIERAVQEAFCKGASVELTASTVEPIVNAEAKGIIARLRFPVVSPGTGPAVRSRRPVSGQRALG
jgi:hypothetical protein